MSAEISFELPHELPQGYRAVPLHAGADVAPIALCVLIKQQPDQLGGTLVALGETIDSQSFLGCLIDRAGRIVRWLQISVQNVSSLAQSPAAARDNLTNALLDRRWEEFTRSAAAADPSAVILTGWESQHPLPMLIDPDAGSCINPVDASTGHRWRLCQDDALLKSRGLPMYSTSLSRFLYLHELADKSEFIQLTSNETAISGAKPLTTIDSNKKLVPLNLHAGMMSVRVFSPLGFEQFVDVLSGAEWNGVRHGRGSLTWMNRARQQGDGISKTSMNGRLLTERQGRAGLLLESLHLKLRLLLDATLAVRNWVAQTQSPLLNLGPESFGVGVTESSGTLPQLWTARCTLSDPGDAVALPVQATDTRYFARAAAATISIYQSMKTSQAVHGSANMRIRHAMDVGNGTLLEGTLVTQQRVQAGRNDLLWIRTNLAGERIDLYSQLEADAALASGEIRFRTVPQRFSANAAGALKAAAGVPIDGVMFEVIPLLSSPCDLYACAALAVRALLVNQENSMPLAVDEALSLARQVGIEHTETAPLAKRIEKLLESDGRWLAAIGPQRLMLSSGDATEALGIIPRELWAATLACIVRMFPGMGPDSICADFSDASSGALHRVFDPAIADLEQLVLRTRSLILVDWRLNREIHSVIQQCVWALSGETAAVGSRA